MTSDKAVGAIHIQQMLELLNASDGNEPRESNARSAEQSNDVYQEATKRFSDPEEVAGFDAKEIPSGTSSSETPVPDDAENRFAAHIVYGMSKLKGG